MCHRSVSSNGRLMGRLKNNLSVNFYHSVECFLPVSLIVHSVPLRHILQTHPGQTFKMSLLIDYYAKPYDETDWTFSMTPTEAARLWKKTRQRLYRDMKSGVLSYTLDDSGQRKVDASEMIRVYGSVDDQPVPSEQNETVPSGQSVSEQENAMIREYIDLLKDQLKAKDDQLKARDTQVQSLIEQLSEANQKLLSSPDDYLDDYDAEPPKRKWWQFGKRSELVD